MMLGGTCVNLLMVIWGPKGENTTFARAPPGTCKSLILHNSLFPEKRSSFLMNPSSSSKDSKRASVFTIPFRES
ncbi:Uncharacterised protein [uncultured archaeon]|nr:Uncharacterised protein [uncultured archaeon]